MTHFAIGMSDSQNEVIIMSNTVYGYHVIINDLLVFFFIMALLTKKYFDTLIYIFYYL